jgi:hypothetical protein
MGKKVQPSWVGEIMVDVVFPSYEAKNTGVGVEKIVEPHHSTEQGFSNG